MEAFTTHTGRAVPLRRSGKARPVCVTNGSMVSPVSNESSDPGGTGVAPRELTQVGGGR